MMIDAHLPNLLSILLHVDDEPIDKPARTARLVVDGLDGRSNYLEVVVRFQGLVHLGLVPQLFEQSGNDAKI